GQLLPGVTPPDRDGLSGILVHSVRVQVHGHVLPDLVVQRSQEAQLHWASLLPDAVGRSLGGWAQKPTANLPHPPPVRRPRTPHPRREPSLSGVAMMHDSCMITGAWPTCSAPPRWRRPAR